MATFNNSGSYSIFNTQKNTYYIQGGHYFDPKTFVDLGTTAPTDYMSLSSERSDIASIVGGSIDGVTIGPGSTINASISGSSITGPIAGSQITGNIDNVAIGQSTPAAGAFTGLNATSASILGALSAEGVNSTSNGQAASTTNTGTSMSTTFAAVTYFDSARTANNKVADFLWNSGSFAARFKNDAGSSTVTWLSASGGQAAGITGITSSSGTGSWAHTGNFTVQTGAISSSAGAGIASPTNSGVNLNFGGNYGIVTLYDSTRTANNRTADLVFVSGVVNLRFVNDGYTGFSNALAITGGQASGVSSIAATTANTSLTVGNNTITSNSGSGSWAHTGNMSLSGGATVNGGTVPSTSTSGAYVRGDGNTPVYGFVDASRSANNKIHEFLFSAGQVVGRFVNDAYNGVNAWLTVTGGQASGVTSIATNSGSGSWAHTGAFSASSTINSSVGLTVKEGSNAKQGVATMVAGTVTVSNTSVTATSRIFLTVQSLGTVTAPKAIAVTARTAGTSFTITSADNTDTSVVAYEIFEVGS